MLSREEIEILTRKQLQGALDPEERRKLTEWLNQEQVPELEWSSRDGSEAELKQRLYHQILTDAGVSTRTRSGRIAILFRRRWGWVAAAMFLLALTGGWWIREGQRAVIPAAVAVQADHLLTPGGDKAVLTLGNGEQVILNERPQGKIAAEGRSQVIKADSGVLRYMAVEGTVAQGAVGGAVYNTITTPRGGQYKLVLADGTKVWLNAASSLRFPTAFTGGSRQVELRGEGYFEVAPDKDLPFMVQAGKETIHVLGTHFNINAYTDEPAIRTTLLEGAVVINGKLRLKPGQQSREAGNGVIIVKDHVDLDAVMAWKDGEFSFEGSDVGAIMRQVARWYDVQIVYKGDLSKVSLMGVISRKDDANDLLSILEKTGKVHFSVEGKTITVSPSAR